MTILMGAKICGWSIIGPHLIYLIRAQYFWYVLLPNYWSVNKLYIFQWIPLIGPEIYNLIKTQNIYF